MSIWKETLRIGVDSIDEQHIQLFAKTEELMDEVQNNGADSKQKYISILRFLKDYAFNHFADEEAYQKSIGYKDFAEHKKLHEKFLQTVLGQEKKLIASDFAEKDIKELTGMLATWLLYHIADADQTYANESAVKAKSYDSHGAIIYGSICDVLNKMAGFDIQAIKKVEKHNETFDDSLVIEVEFSGDISGYIALVYPVMFIKNLIDSMMGFMPEAIEELELSALFEASNIISGTICRQIAAAKGIFCDIGPPSLLQRLQICPQERIALDTGKGIIEVDTEIIYK